MPRASGWHLARRAAFSECLQRSRLGLAAFRASCLPPRTHARTHTHCRALSFWPGIAIPGSIPGIIMPALLRESLTASADSDATDLQLGGTWKPMTLQSKVRQNFPGFPNPPKAGPEASGAPRQVPSAHRQLVPLPGRSGHWARSPGRAQLSAAHPDARAAGPLGPGRPPRARRSLRLPPWRPPALSPWQRRERRREGSEERRMV